MKHKKHVFATPTAEEGVFVSKIFQIPHFRQNIEQRKLLKGGRNADPFVIARAHAIGGVVVTMERRKPNSAGIPAIGDHFAIKCVSLEEFMELKKWQF